MVAIIQGILGLAFGSYTKEFSKNTHIPCKKVNMPPA